MSKKFHAENRITGARWEPEYKNIPQYLVMYDSGYLAVVTDVGAQDWNPYIRVEPLDPKVWRTVIHKDQMVKLAERLGK